jgi:hypothetical protein
MGRPPSCGCCGASPGIDPVLTCNTNYWSQPWQTVVENNVTKFSQSGIFTPAISGDLQQIRWEFANWGISGNLLGFSNCCPDEPWDCTIISSGFITEYFAGDIYNDYNLIKCDYTDQETYNYNFIYKKTFNVESGVSIYGQITAAQNPCVDAEIFISGNQITGIHTLSKIYPEWNAWRFINNIGCVQTFCNYEEITLPSGTYDIIISGSTSRFNFDPGIRGTCADCCVPLKGFIDFLIIPCANAQNINGVNINSLTPFVDYPSFNTYFSYNTFCFNGSINGVSDFCGAVNDSNGSCYDCYLKCSGCSSWYRSGPMPATVFYSGGWWNYQDNLFLDASWLAACSGLALSCGPPTAEDSGRFNIGNGIQYPIGNGWAIGPASCGIATVTGVCYVNGVPYTIYYSDFEQIGACCINGDCCEITCKDCVDAGGDWNGAGSRCFGENRIFCSEGEF